MKMPKIFFPLLSLLFFASGLIAQEEAEAPKTVEQVLSQRGYDEVAPAIVKLVSDGGSKIGTGALVGVTFDENKGERIGFILTAYSMVAGRDKVAVILKNHSDALLGHVVEKWIDFDLDIAIVAVRNFPAGQPMVTFGPARKKNEGDLLTTLMHTDRGDWIPVPTPLKSVDASHLTMSVRQRDGLEGAPLVDEGGSVVALFVSEETLSSGNMPLASAVKTSVVKPLLNEWFQPIRLEQQWNSKGAAIAGWMWAVGGGVATGTVVTVLAISGGDNASGKGGLPGPPAPPPVPGGSQ